MSEVAELLRGVAAILWVVVAFVAIWAFRKLATRDGSVLRKLGVGPTGVTLEFVQAQVEEAISRRKASDDALEEPIDLAIGNAANRSVAERLERHSDLLKGAAILWVDDHPENNRPLIELLRAFGASVDTPRSNQQAFALLRGTKYDAVITDVGRDDEGPGSDLKGIEFADQLYSRWNQRVLVLSARFNPAGLPGLSDAERLDVVSRVDRTVFAYTNRGDELLHYLLDMLER